MPDVDTLQFKNEFAEFRQTDDGKIRSALRQAALFVDPLVVDNPIDAYWATVYLAAHLLTTGASHGSDSSSSDSSLDNETFVQSISIGDRRVTFGKRASSGVSSADIISGKLDSTWYGNLYWMLLRRYTSGPHVI